MMTVTAASTRVLVSSSLALVAVTAPLAYARDVVGAALLYADESDGEAPTPAALPVEPLSFGVDGRAWLTGKT